MWAILKFEKRDIHQLKYELSKKTYNSIKTIGPIYAWHASINLAQILLETTNNEKLSIKNLDLFLRLCSFLKSAKCFFTYFAERAPGPKCSQIFHFFATIMVANITNIAKINLIIICPPITNWIAPKKRIITNIILVLKDETSKCLCWLKI